MKVTKKEERKQIDEIIRRGRKKACADLPPLDMSNPEVREAVEYYRAVISDRIGSLQK